MKIEEFLLGPFASQDREYWVKWNREHPEAQVLYRDVVVAFKDGKVLKEPPGKLKELLKCENGTCRTCVLHFNVIFGEWDVKAPVWALKDITDMAATDALFDGSAKRCTEQGLKPTIIDKIQIDIDLPEEHPSPKVRDWWGRLTPFERAVRVAQRLKRALSEQGIDAAFIFSGHKGFHVLLVPAEPLPVSLRGSIIKALADTIFKKAVPWLEVDSAALDMARKLRMPGTIHTETREYAKPFDPDTGEFIDFQWPRPVPKDVVGWLAYLYAINNPPPAQTRPRIQAVKPKRVDAVGMRSAVEEALGEIEYDARLDGFGWVEVLVKEKIPIHDARNSFAWAVLPVAVRGPKTKEGPLPPLVTEEEAVEWLKTSIEKYPDPGGSTLEDYIKKFQSNLRYGEKYNIPTWRHLLAGIAEDGRPLNEVFKHMKYPILWALYQAGYIKLSEEQVKRLKELAHAIEREAQ